MRRFIDNWLIRHRHPASRALHAVGIPLLVAGLLLGAWQLWHGQWPLWWRPVGLIGASYVLQGIGHAIEGNDMGEVVLIRKLRGKPYNAIAPSSTDRVNSKGYPGGGQCPPANADET